ncbi:major facilitator superfamily protein [Hirsutella rhossiliensis]|uniref:Major facilitator superfamily domain-containing protein n=1 Tax=Hirsutella rhossiliensis TaxID=111463 RepID=A0A9P8MS24_9HYPO|nr:major facilitator superfamily domain-containing protein [Hirsutella rhossiliensis]KAH0960235.1 major facilitator superfamily domain-containing protein [Hirsutella rhossiliensis]
MEPKRPRNGEKTPGFKCFLLRTSLLAAVFLYGLDNAVVANIQPVIATHFHVVDGLPWLSAGFMIGGLAVVMPLGNLYAVYEAKRLFLFFTVNFLAALALCGAAPSMPAEIVGRAWAGAGGNGMLHGLLTLVVRTSSARQLPVHLGYASIVCVLGFVLGPTVGGALELPSWRWALYLNIFLGLFVLLAGVFLIPSEQPTSRALARSTIPSLDLAGTLLSTGSIVPFAVAANCAGVLFNWTGSITILLYAVSAILLVGFVLQQAFCIFTASSAPLFPARLLRNTMVLMRSLFVAGSGILVYLALYYVPLYFQLARGASAVETAKHTLPLLLPLAFAVFASRCLVANPACYKLWMILGSAVGLIGAVLMSMIRVEAPMSATYGYQAMLGLGAGFFAQAAFAAAQTEVDSDNGTSDAILMLLGQMSGLGLGLSAAGAIFVNTAKSRLADAFPNLDDMARSSMLAGTRSELFSSLGERDQALASVCIVAALRKVFIEAYVAATLASVLSFLAKLDRKATVNQTDNREVNPVNASK